MNSKGSQLIVEVFIISLGFLGLIGTSAVAQDKKPASADEVLRVETTLVLLPVRVKERSGKIRPGLAQSQFHVFEDGIEQEIAYFEPFEANDDPRVRPLTLALMLDVSDSTQTKLEQIRRAANDFVDLLRPDDRAMIITFDGKVRILTRATADRNLLHAAISDARSGGGTSLYRAVALTIRELDRVSGRKAMVLLTDGVDTSSKGVTSQETIKLAEQSYVAIYPIQYDTYGDFTDSPSRETFANGEFGRTAHVTKNGEPASEAYKRATLYLRLLADKTSGEFQYTDSVKNLTRSFEKIALQLRQQYCVGYYPKNKTEDGKPRQIKVEVSLPGVEVETRRSYVYKPSSHQ